MNGALWSLRAAVVPRLDSIKGRDAGALREHCREPILLRWQSLPAPTGSGDTALVGAPRDDDEGTGAGAAYVLSSQQPLPVGSSRPARPVHRAAPPAELVPRTSNPWGPTRLAPHGRVRRGTPARDFRR
ncbi:FG-GAP repeat protein [Sorangium sp. So ce1000]|uniref:FG-GAP repeat protein n=1 Tax=Sorangium sp. So ce1000 TaxID=3133325 RepID=UPI003F62A1AB